MKATEFQVYATNFAVTQLLNVSNEFRLTWNSVPGIHYYVQAKSALTDPYWTTISPTLTAVDYLTTFRVPISGPSRFFRVHEGLALQAQPTAISSVSHSTNGLLLRWTAPTDPQLHFRVQWTSSLTPPAWATFTNLLSSANGDFSFLDDGSQSGGLGPARYYRLLQLP